MKLLGFSIPGFFLMIFSCPVLASPGTLQFFEGDFTELKVEAAQKQIPYFIYFYQEQSEDCKRMDQETFQFPALVDYADQRYLPYRLSQAEGSSPATRFNVTVYPTLRIYGPGGQVWGSIEGHISGEELLLTLQEYRRTFAFQLSALAELEDQLPIVPSLLEQSPSTSPMCVSVIPHPAKEAVSRGGAEAHSFLDPLSNKEKAMARLSAREQTAAVPIRKTIGRSFEMNQTIALSGPVLSDAWRIRMGLYHSDQSQKKISSLLRHNLRNHPEHKNFGIEVARFSKLEDLEQEVRRFERIWKGDIWAHRDGSSKGESFLLILGAYSTREKASHYAKAMKRDASINPGVVDFREILKPNL